MIETVNNMLSIGTNKVTFPIRIQKAIELDDKVIVALGFSYELDVQKDWDKGGKELWTKLNSEFNQPTIICLSATGKEMWRFSKFGFYNIEKVNEISILDPRVKNWIENNQLDKELFLVIGEETMIVDAETGDILITFEGR